MPREFVNGGSLDISGGVQRCSWGNILNSGNVFTIGFLFKLKAGGSSNYDVVYGYGTGRWYFILNGSGGNNRKLAFNFQSSSGEKTSGYITNNLDLDTWYTVIGSHDPSGSTFIEIYDMAGNLVDSATATNAFNISTTFNSLAAGYDTTRSLAVNARFKNFRIWNRVLTIGERANLAINTPVERTGLLLETLCNEGWGTSLRNTAVNDALINAATLTGSPIMSPDCPLPFQRARVLNN